MGEWAAVRAVLFAVFGLAFGSFLNVAIHRLPLRQSLLRPGSACPRCGTPIAARDNVPVASYLLLGGRCRHCREPISPRYPLVEAATAALFALAAVSFEPVAQAVLVAPFLGVMLAAAMIDVRHRIIPNRLMYPSIPLFAAAIVAAWAIGGPLDPVRAVLSLLAFGGALLVVAVVAPKGMGMGDVKLAALIGLVLGALGWAYVLVAALLGFLAGGVGGVVALLLGRGRKDTIPFGPYLALGAVLAAFLAPAIAGWYLDALGVRALAPGP